MFLRPSVTIPLAAGLLLLGGCATPWRETAGWPRPPAALRVVPAENTGVDASRLLTRFELQFRLVEAGAHFAVMSDEHYVLINHAALPVLLDWYGAMVAVYGFSPEGLQGEGFRRDRGGRLLRTAVATGLMRHDASPAAAPAIGMIRVKLLQPWGRLAAGEAGDFLALGTERGLFIVDPVSRQIRPLARDRAFWRFETVRF